jgi:hypothetical protein
VVAYGESNVAVFSESDVIATSTQSNQLIACMQVIAHCPQKANNRNKYNEKQHQTARKTEIIKISANQNMGSINNYAFVFFFLNIFFLHSLQNCVFIKFFPDLLFAKQKTNNAKINKIKCLI